MEDGTSRSAVAAKEVKNIREHYCSSDSKELRCYMCVSRASCEIGCDFRDKKEEGGAQEGPIVPTEVFSPLILEEKEKVEAYLSPGGPAIASLTGKLGWGSPSAAQFAAYFRACSSQVNSILDVAGGRVGGVKN
jgi:hypothetical protein